MVEFLRDGMVYPKESSLFGSIDKDGNMLTMKDQEIYKNDTFGLKSLDDLGKIYQLKINGTHLEFTDQILNTVFVPFITQGVYTIQPEGGIL